MVDDVQRLTSAVAAFDYPMASAVIAGAVAGAVCVGVLVRGVRRSMTSAECNHRSMPTSWWATWRRWVVLVWAAVVTLAGLWTHPRFASGGPLRLTTPLGGATVAYVDAIMITLAVAIGAVLVVLPFVMNVSRSGQGQILA